MTEKATLSNFLDKHIVKLIFGIITLSICYIVYTYITEKNSGCIALLESIDNGIDFMAESLGFLIGIMFVSIREEIFKREMNLVNPNLDNYTQVQLKGQILAYKHSEVRLLKFLKFSFGIWLILNKVILKFIILKLLFGIDI